MNMQIVEVPTAAEGAYAAGELVAEAIGLQASLVLGLATGRSPAGLYDDLVERVASGRLTMAGVRGVLLDDVVGPTLDTPGLFRNVIRRSLVDRVDMPASQLTLPQTDRTDLDAVCRDYDEQIAVMGGIDLLILGVGADGHLGFNEPGTDLGARVRVAPLSDDIRRTLAPGFGDSADALHSGLTLGPANIFEARRVLLLAFGAEKAQAIRTLTEGPVTSASPVSVLRSHPALTVLVDEAAAGAA